ncbi:hypothetical protein B5181_42665, partial [Streptomyces sp. 4F]
MVAHGRYPGRRPEQHLRPGSPVRTVEAARRTSRAAHGPTAGSPDDRNAVPGGPVLPRRPENGAGPRHLRGPAGPHRGPARPGHHPLRHADRLRGTP